MEVDRFEFAAAFKCTVADNRHPLRDFNTGKTDAVLESVSADCSDVASEGDGLQAAAVAEHSLTDYVAVYFGAHRAHAVLEDVISDIHHSSRNFDVVDAYVVGKYLVTDRLHSIGKQDSAEAVAVRKCMVINLKQ